AHGLSSVPSDACTVLMHADDRRVDHLNRGIVGSGKRVHDPTPDAGPSPANEAVVASGVGTEVARKVTPRCARPQHPKNAIQDTPIIHTRHAAGLARQHRPDGSPLIFREFVAHDSCLHIGGLNHDPPSSRNTETAAVGMSAFGAKPEIFCSIRAAAFPLSTPDLLFSKSVSLN